MNPDVIRLALGGSRRAWGKPAGIVFGIAVGVGLLLTLLGAANGLQNRDTRTAWLYPHMIENAPPGEMPPATLAPDMALIRTDVDYYGSKVITRRDIAVAPDSTLRLPWGAAPPAPGTYLASPALLQMIERTPPGALGDRYGTLAGEIPASALASPDSLVVLSGQTAASLRTDYPTVVMDLAGLRHASNPVYRSIIVVGGIAMFLPVLLFVSIVTQLGAAQRAERFATFRLIGADAGIVVRLAALEMASLSLIGAVLGVLGWRLSRPVAAAFSVDDGRFYGNDLALSLTTIVMVAIAAVLAATVVAGWRMGRAGIGPLGVTRERFERAPSALRLVPLLAGLGAIFLATRTWRNQESAAIVQLALIGGFTLTAMGIVLIGPWLTALLSRLALRRTRSAAGVIAASRIRLHPAATFRSVSGLVLGVFVASVFAGAASSVLSARDPEADTGLLPLSALSAAILGDGSQAETTAAAQDLVTKLRTIPGVTVATLAWVDDEGDSGLGALDVDDAEALGLASGQGTAYVDIDLYGAIFDNDADNLGTAQPVTTLAGRQPVELLVGTDGTTVAIERARTMLEASPVVVGGAFTRSDLADRDTRRFVNSMATLAYIGIAITILIAGISLAVATAAAILDRKRIFGLLRLTGMPSRTLRDIVVIEAVVPLMAVVALSIGFGFFVAWLIVEGLSTGRSMHWPDGRYVVTIVASTLMAICAVAATMGIVQSNTTISQTRFE